MPGYREADSKSSFLALTLHCVDGLDEQVGLALQNSVILQATCLFGPAHTYHGECPGDRPGPSLLIKDSIVLLGASS